MRYDKIINMPHPSSKKHYPMSVYNRAAQFAPFAALSGYDEAVTETARLTDSRLELDDDMAAELDMKTQILIEHASELPEIDIEYFVADRKKSGGAYHRLKGNFRWFDSGAGAIVLSGGESVPVRDIYRIEGRIFSDILGKLCPDS